MSEQKHPINELMATTMEQIKNMAGANTVVGEPIQTEGGVTLIPVSKISWKNAWQFTPVFLP